MDYLNRLNENQAKAHEIQKKELRWKNIRTAAWLTFGALSIGLYVLISMLFYSSVHDGPPSEDYVSLLRIDGMIAADQKISAQRINPALVRAFRDTKSKGVVLLVNSPGGSPVQASLIRDRLMELRREFPDKKVVTVAEDALASGAYMIATGTQEIYVNRSTIAGSIGVIMSGFGLDGAIGRFGIERRIYTSGENKSRLDSFKPVSKDDVGKIQGVLADVHRHFIDAVLEARKDKLRGDRGISSIFRGVCGFQSAQHRRRRNAWHLHGGLPGCAGPGIFSTAWIGARPGYRESVQSHRWHKHRRNHRLWARKGSEPGSNGGGLQDSRAEHLPEKNAV
ncbi:peptidase S49 [Sulfurifustis variabilis]|uniref:Peptidase S49 n=1 Tax=Sulfurifustis variabilis TaxID=1675686 RepID=A0A1B4V7T0_9GAMM|nr:peptidase S49 [Sulfurifustis variabilis]